MNSPYSIQELDAFMNAAIEFDDDHNEQFSASNISGRGGVPADGAATKRMAEWIAATDRGLIESLGMGNDDITYFRVGLDARSVMRGGGMGAYVARRTRAERLEKARLWIPIVISLVAITLSILTFIAPRSTDRKIDALRLRLDSLQAEQAASATAIGTLRMRIDSVVTARAVPKLPAGRTK